MVRVAKYLIYLHYAHLIIKFFYILISHPKLRRQVKFFYILRIANNSVMYNKNLIYLNTKFNINYLLN
jgi:hypothetical protein